MEYTSDYLACVNVLQELMEQDGIPPEEKETLREARYIVMENQERLPDELLE